MLKEDYYCDKCNRTHKAGSKIWKKHMKEKLKIKKITPINKSLKKNNKKNNTDIYDENFVEEIIKEMENEDDYSFEIPQKEVGESDASLWKRIAAYLIDCSFFYLVLFQIFMLIFLPMVGLDFETVADLEAYIIANPQALGLIAIGFFSSLFIFLAYFMLVEKNFKTTIGKKLMKLEIKSENKLTYTDVFFRNITKTVMFFLLPIDFLGMFDKKNQRFTEKLSRTKVIYHMRLSIIYESW